MAHSTLWTILEAVAARLRAITVAGGYYTDAGLHVSIGPRDLTTDDPLPQLAVGFGQVVPVAQGRQVQRQVDLRVEAIAAADFDDPLLPLADVLEDIDRALFVPIDKSLGGLLAMPHGLKAGPVEAQPREPGSRVVSAVVGATAQYVEAYGGAA